MMGHDDSESDRRRNKVDSMLAELVAKTKRSTELGLATSPPTGLLSPVGLLSLPGHLSMDSGDAAPSQAHARLCRNRYHGPYPRPG